MLIVKVEKNNIDRAVKAMRYKIFKSKQLKQLREGQAFKKKSTKRQEQLREAIYTEKWKRENEG